MSITRAAVLGIALAAIRATAAAESIAVLPSPAGTTPRLLGYNLAHFLEGTNAADRFRFSGVNAARIFIGAADIEPTDDLPPVGDGVGDEAGFFARRSLLRANAASATEPLNTGYVKWSRFSANYDNTQFGNNRLKPGFALGNLRDRGLSLLVNISASPSRFPLTGDADWAGKWELWQHYYAQAFLLSRDYGVPNFSMFNEPNNFDGLTVEDWLVRYRFCSDAIQSAVADMNSRYGRAVVPRVYAPNTANGAEKYDPWGSAAVQNRHLRLDGTLSAEWMNLRVYNYQKYTHRAFAADGFSGFIEDYDSLRASIDGDMPGEPRLPMALTEFNVRTGALYDTTVDTQDSPGDFTALGMNCVALTERGIAELYLFKFGQTASDSFYGVAKNGTHYVENSGSYSYGGPTKAADVYRLFVKMAAGAKPRLDLARSAGAMPGFNAGVWSLATVDPETGDYAVFIVNRDATALPLTLDFSALPVAPGNPVYVQEVSATAAGGGVRLENLVGGILPEAQMPAQSVWLATVSAAPVSRISAAATADTELADGSGKNTPGGSVNSLTARADGTVNGRRATLIRIPVPAGNSPNIRSVILEIEAAATAGGVPVLAQVYGIEDSSWIESTATWAGMTGTLKQGVAAGNLIKNNVVVTGGGPQILGEILVDSANSSVRRLDVTAFAKSRTDGMASFLIVQDHRWDVAQPELTAGDTQPAGLAISSRESGAAGPRLIALVGDVPGTARAASEATVRGGTSAGTDVDEAAAGYLMVKFNAGLDAARKSYFQFDLPAMGADLDAGADFSIGFQNVFSQRVQLWSVDAGGFLSPAITWNGAPANDPASNGMLPAATAIGADVRINPGSALAPFTFRIPRLGDHIHGGRLTLALSGVDDLANNSGGLRIARNSASLVYGVAGASPFAAWRQAEFGGDAGNQEIAGALADPDRDGLPNLLEYALGGQPLVPQSGISPAISRSGMDVLVTFGRNPAATDLLLVVQWSDSLDGDWQPAAISENGAAFAATGGGVAISEDAQHCVTLTAAANGRRFFRLAATLPGG